MYHTPNFRIAVPTADEARTYGRGDIEASDGSPIRRTNGDVDLYVKMAKIVSQRHKDAALAGKNFFPGPQYRLSGFNAEGGRLSLSLGPTDYGEFIGTNVAAGMDPEYMRELLERGRAVGDEDAYFSNTLAVCSVVVTSDGKILVGLRADEKHMAEYPRCWHTIGGHPNPVNYRLMRPDLFDAMAQEISKERGIPADEIMEMEVTGLMRNMRTRKPELLFRSRIKPTYAELRDRRGEEDYEHTAFFGLESPEELAAFLRANQDAFAFPESCGLGADERMRIAPSKKPDNTTNYFVPPGEASWVLYLMHRFSGSRDVLMRELPYLEASESPAA